MQDFTKVEAKGKIGQRVRVILDGAFFRHDIKKGMKGKINAAAPSSILLSPRSPQALDPKGDVWAVSVEFDDISISGVPGIHREEYMAVLKEI